MVSIRMLNYVHIISLLFMTLNFLDINPCVRVFLDLYRYTFMNKRFSFRVKS